MSKNSIKNKQPKWQKVAKENLVHIKLEAQQFSKRDTMWIPKGVSPNDRVEVVFKNRVTDEGSAKFYFWEQDKSSSEIYGFRILA